ncbi:uncharacterized protein LOC127240393 [Andrographis paniculata]|uniref:uncharacterized protein LOC127240393 n=1 Tax=Andrographis paniculata TaxID=175694 RepID=UPI0021E8FF54|nr:uncharacterized protein LOC127240393 [Andrographis paniculata]
MADAVFKSKSGDDNANQSSSKFLRHFLYKAAIITLFLVLLPIFPSIAPEFLNQTLHARSWELLHLIFVGIAVSYGLFSKKNDDLHKDHYYASKLDNAQSYVSKLLHVSSVFDDDSDHNVAAGDDSKVQTWSSQYFRGEPPVLVVAAAAAAKENDAVSELGHNKPLLLPVRSLKQQANEEGAKSDSRIRTGFGSNSASRRFVRSSRRLKTAEDGGAVSTVEKMEDVSAEDNVVLRSPIPWRSRSGRMEVKQNDEEDGDGGGYLVPPLMEEQEASRIESRSFKSTKPNKPSTSSPFSSEPSGEDVARKKAFLSPPPPPPPPPPAPRKPVLLKSNSSAAAAAVAVAAAPKKALRRSVRSVPTEEAEIADGISPSSGRSVRTFRGHETAMETSPEKAVKKPAYSNKAKIQQELAEKVILESSSDDDEEEEEPPPVVVAEEGGGRISNGGGAAIGDENEDCVNELGRDVDKKADEFIAKFREQIRLQRIESIRRSTAQRAGRTFR